MFLLSANSNVVSTMPAPGDILDAIMNEYLRAIARAWPPLLLLLLSISAQALGGVEAMRYDRVLVVVEPWRLLSGHLVHLSWSHLALNLAGVMLLWALFGHLMQMWVWCLAFVWCALAVSSGLYLFDSDLAWYVGLSGVMHGMLMLGALASLLKEQRMALFLLVVTVSKITWEQFTGSDAGTQELVGGAVIVNAHLYGVLAGVACAPLIHIGRRTD